MSRNQPPRQNFRVGESSYPPARDSWPSGIPPAKRAAWAERSRGLWMQALARMTVANLLPFALNLEPFRSPYATTTLLLPGYKRLYTGDTCPLIPRVTLPYHTSMACSNHNSVKLRSPLSFGQSGRVDSLAQAQVRTMAQSGPKRPGMAHSAYLIPIWAAAHFRATDSSHDPHFKYETAQNGPKWRGNKKLVLCGGPRGRRKPIG